MFKNWLLDTKDGRHWGDFLVLPEGAVTALRRKVETDQRLPPATDAASGWKRLSTWYCHAYAPLQLSWMGGRVAGLSDA